MFVFDVEGGWKNNISWTWTTNVCKMHHQNHHILFKRISFMCVSYTHIRSINQYKRSREGLITTYFTT